VLSAVVITLNEESNIAACLESINFADEIIVVDSGSSDRTIELAGKYTGAVLQNPWQGFGAQKNFGIARAKGDWILSIDADERVTHELAAEIKSAVSSGGNVDGYYLPRLASFCGHWIRHCGWYPDYQLRLFRKARGEFNGRPVHEGVIVNGRTGFLKNDLMHYSYDSISQYFEKFNRYTNLSAAELSSKRKFSFLRMLGSPVSYFIKSYFLKLGFLDGVPGLIVCIFGSYSNFVKYAKLWELQRKNRKQNK